MDLTIVQICQIKRNSLFPPVVTIKVNKTQWKHIKTHINHPIIIRYIGEHWNWWTKIKPKKKN